MISHFVLFSIQPTLKPFYEFNDVETGCCGDISILHTAYFTLHAIFYESTSNLDVCRNAVQRNRECFYPSLNLSVGQWLEIQGQCILKVLFLYLMVSDVQLQQMSKICSSAKGKAFFTSETIFKFWNTSLKRKLN